MGPRGKWASRLLGLASLLPLWATACGADGQFAALSQQGVGGESGWINGTGGYSVGPCHPDGQSRPCTVDLGPHGQTVTCIEGTQTCTNGEWSDCQQKTVHARKLRKGALPDLAASLGREVLLDDLYDPPAQPGLPRALNAMATGCMSACDPSCQEFTETPSGAVGAPIAGPPVHNGSIGNLPGGLVNKGLKSNCETALDCQFGTYCADPVTDSSCGHDKCATGLAMSSTCEANDACVNQICNSPGLGYCCSLLWDSSCVKAVHDVCGAYCDNVGTSTCAHNHCYTGDALSLLCGDTCVAAVCLAHPSCCLTGWDSTCVGYVATTAGCSAADQCPTTHGQCIGWTPGQVDKKCSGVDLYLGVPCSGGSSIPVCNAGSKDSTGTFRIIGFSANSSNMPSLPPSCGGGGCYKNECISSLTIPSGQCVDVPCSSSFGNNQEIYVDPPATPYGTAVPQLAECDYKNNWSINNNSQSCDGPNCTPQQGTLVGAAGDIIITADRSSALGANTWSGIQQGIQAFVGEAASQTSAPALKVALSVFPNDGAGAGQCLTTGPTACDSTKCQTPFQGYTSLQTGASTVSTAIGGVGQSTKLGPTGAALGGAYLAATADYNAATRKPHPMVVLIMGSDPINCSDSVASLATQAGQAYAANGTRTFVIGIGLSSSSAAQTIATAGNGVGFNFADASAATTRSNVQSALDTIRGYTLPCTISLPSTAVWDINNPLVQIALAGSQTKTTISKVSASSSCGSGDGFYYDNNSAPTTLTLCPKTCSTASSAEAKTYVTLDCTGHYAGSTVPLSPYSAGTLCPTGTRVQWDYLAYSTVTPSTTTITFGAQTGPSTTSLTPTTPILLATAESTPTDTQYCPLGALPPGPGAACPVDIYSTLNAVGRADDTYLNLVVTLNPQTLLTPTINYFTLTFSCPDVQ